jgi:hypothetical protein
MQDYDVRILFGGVFKFDDDRKTLRLIITYTEDNKMHEMTIDLDGIKQDRSECNYFDIYKLGGIQDIVRLRNSLNGLIAWHRSLQKKNKSVKNLKMISNIMPPSA